MTVFVGPNFLLASLLAAIWITGFSGFSFVLRKGVLVTAATVLVSFQDTSSPVIGILSQPLHSIQNDTNNNKNPHYIAASYVKWLEAGGARSIPIPYDADSALLDDLLDQVNAVLLPGGAAAYSDSVTLLLDKVVASNKAGNYLPVWGTCLGFEFLVQYAAAAGPDNILQSGFDAENVSLSLEQVQPVSLYADPDTYFTVTQRNVTMNNHQNGITPERFQSDKALSAVWRITSINYDKAGRPFVSTIEPVDNETFPFYGVQYHPEKNAFEYATYPGTNIPYEAIDHSAPGIRFSMYTAEFFVDLARQSLQRNRQHSYTKEGTYPPVYTYPIQVGLGFEQIYLVPTAAHWTNRTNLRSSNKFVSTT